MLKTFVLVAAATAALAACGPDTETAAGDNTAGPVVAASETPRNEAIDITPTTGATTQTPGANSFTEPQARGALVNAGYTAIGPLTLTAEGLWQGSGVKDGQETAVSIDYKGAVTPL